MQLTRTKQPEDAFDAPAYPLNEAARYLRLPVTTLRAWVVGRPYPKGCDVVQSQPLFEPPARDPVRLSFSNLVEAHVLRALRTEHGVSLPALRKAKRFAEERLHIDRLLLSKHLCTEGGRIFLDEYGKLIELSASGQIAMRKVLEAHLQRVEWKTPELPIRLYPFISAFSAGPVGEEHKPIAIDPRIAFGRPVVARKSISTQTIAERIDAGESVEDVARDYDLEANEVEEAVVYERAA